MWDLERVWVRLSSLSQGRGSGRRDGGALPVSALSNICQPIHHQGLLPVIVIVQVQHRHPKRVDDTTASGSFIPRIKGVHNDGLRPLYFAATEWAALAV